MKEIILDLSFITEYWKDTQQKLEDLYNNGYRKVTIHILNADDLNYEMLAEEAAFHGFWVKLIVTGGKKMRSCVRHYKPEEVYVLRDKKGKMRALLNKKLYIEVDDNRWVNRKAVFGEALNYQLPDPEEGSEECLN